MFEPKKRCSKCREWKYEGEFRLQGTRLASWCDSCFVRTPSENARYNRSVRESNRHTFLLSSSRYRAKQRGLPFDLDDYREQIRDRVYAGICELSSLPFDLKAEGAATRNSPSIDRVRPELGYVYSNIRIICHALNTAIGPWGEQVTATLMKAWLANRR